jgi:hypothetical protein
MTDFSPSLFNLPNFVISTKAHHPKSVISTEPLTPSVKLVITLSVVEWTGGALFTPQRRDLQLARATSDFQLREKVVRILGVSYLFATSRLRQSLPGKEVRLPTRFRRHAIIVRATTE